MNETDVTQGRRSRLAGATLWRLTAVSVFALNFGAVMANAQDPNTANSNQVSSYSHVHARVSDACGLIVTTRDASRCIGSAQTRRAIPRLDPHHAYDLLALIDIAEDASPAGRIAWAAAKVSLEQEGIDQALYLPVLTFAALGADARAIVPFPKPIAPRGYVTVEQPLASAQLELAYSVLDFGRGARLDGGKALELASTLTLSRTQQTIAYSTSLQFYRTQQSAGQLAAAETIVQTAETLLNNAQLQYDNGRSTLPDLQNAQAGAAEARFDLAAAKGEVKKAKLALSETVGVEPTPDFALQEQQLDTPAAVDVDIDDVIAAAWKSRPDLLARAQDVRRARDVSRMTRSAYLPKVTIDATGGQEVTWPTADYGQLGYANVTTWSADVRLRWELFNGARSHQVAAALAEQTSAAEEQRETQDAVTREVWEAYVDYETAAEQQRSSRSFLTAAETSYDSSLDAYKYGVRSLVDVVEAERQLAQAWLAVVRSQAQLMQSAVALSYAAGSMPGSSGGHP